MDKKKRSLALLTALCMIICTLASCGQSGSAGNNDEKKADGGYTIDNIRDYVIGLDEEMELGNGSKMAVTNFDNAATTPALQPVADEVNEELKKYGSIGRGSGLSAQGPSGGDKEGEEYGKREDGAGAS